ncbi:dTDP-4-amino-4,6-dideoxygalactose transaminase [Ruminococcus sp.]|uniref:dTDP-4-amino-4,6-dideoxygalactose transaminase n=1 Tax=Ruminococcus sp. TaxID=41978 RepID=UPI0025F6E426|nr:dTDP-4-amino-4,6-dideoxygalactose transaminase [Ruminococcus sp.]
MSLIHFNVPPFVGKEFEYMREAVENHKICGDGPFTKRCNEWLEERFGAKKAMLTTSGSTALDMAALLCDLKPGDEVILPSYTFSSTANSFVLAGATLVFVDIRPDTMNIDETKIEAAITERTKVIVPVHYAGVACEMDTILDIARRHNLMVVEDAAQGVMSTYKGRALGTMGDFGCFSFHETKNYSMGEGGAILINNEAYIEKAEILREKGTNRSQFFRGQVAKYNWVDFGDSYLQSDLNAAFLWAQLEEADFINNNRLATWKAYMESFKEYADAGKICLPTIPKECVHNAHMFYIKFPDLNLRQKYINYMKENEILCVFHYVPLHSAPAGLKFGRFNGVDVHTTADSDRLVRLPMYYNIEPDDLKKVITKTREFLNTL